MTYTKSLVPHIYRLIPQYIQKKYPKYVSLLCEFALFLENTNYMSWYTDSVTNQKANSIYHNICDFQKHLIFSEFPVENKDVVDKLYKDYARTLDFQNTVLSFSDIVTRRFLQYSETIYNLKDSWKAYNFIFAILSNYFINSGENSTSFEAYFNTDENFDTETPPSFYSVLEVSSTDISNFFYSQFVKNASGSATAYGYVKYVDTTNNRVHVDTYTSTEFATGENLYDEDGVLLTSTTTITNISVSSIGQTEVILVEYPVYTLTFDIEGNLVEVDEAPEKGTRPFEYQIISKSPIMTSGNFVKNLKEAVHPAGFRGEIIYVPDDMEADVFLETKVFPKIISESDALETDTFDPIARLTESGNNIDINSLETQTILKNENTERSLRVRKLVNSGNL